MNKILKNLENLLKEVESSKKSHDDNIVKTYVLDEVYNHLNSAYNILKKDKRIYGW